MSNRTNSLRGVAVVAVAAAALSLPMMTAAHAQTDVHRVRHHHHVRIYNTTRDPAPIARPLTPYSYSVPAANEINSTYPEGMPSYSGGNGP
jgi:hypothetical protein